MLYDQIKYWSQAKRTNPQLLMAVTVSSLSHAQRRSDRLDTVTRPNATRQQVSFDAANRLTASYEEKMSGTTVIDTLWSALYGYDKANRLTSFAPLPMERGPNQRGLAGMALS